MIIITYVFKDGERPEKINFELSSEGIRQVDEITEINPVVQIRQKSKFVRKQQHSRIREIKVKTS